MKPLKSFLTLILLVVATLSFAQTTEPDTTRILFIGNSYTYFNSLPELVKGLSQEKLPAQVIETALISQGGMSLKRHWQNDKTLPAIRSGRWDYVVLQEQSKLGMAVMIDNDIYFGETDLFFEYARKFAAEIKTAGAKTVFFMTWSVRDRPEEQDILTYAYSTMAKEHGAILAPVGLVWEQVRANDKINLYVRDGSHPSALGSYLAATTIFATILEDSPIGLSGSISGKRLSSSGKPSLASQPLVDISSGDALEIQTSSWGVVEAMQKSGAYPNVQKPKQNYKVPVLTQGEDIELKDITGRWYGTTTYGSNYLGLILDVEDASDKLGGRLSFYSPDQQDRLTVQSASIEENQLSLTIYDSLRRLNATIRFALKEKQMEGILNSVGTITMYKHLSLSRHSIQNEVDIAAFDLLMQSFQANIVKDGYLKAAINHYAEYSKLKGSTYLPEERYLNVQGYNFLRDKKVNDALDRFELAMTLYPQSVNTYDSYAEGLVVAGQKEKALEIYIKAVALAKKTDYENLDYIEANLKKLEEEMRK
jgi:hypothetical protein